MKLDELLYKAVAGKTIFQRKKNEIPMRLDDWGTVMDISNKKYTTYATLKKEDILADDWEIIEKVLPKARKVDFFEAYRYMKKGKYICRYKKERKYEEKDFFYLDDTHGIMDKAGRARNFSRVELDAEEWVVVRDNYFSFWRKDFVDDGEMFISEDEPF